MKLIEDEDLTGQAVKLGATVMSKLESAQLPGLGELRGKGLMIGMELEEARPAKDVWNKCMARGLIVCIAKNNVLRLAPPLTTEGGWFPRNEGFTHTENYMLSNSSVACLHRGCMRGSQKDCGSQYQPDCRGPLV